uniref:WKF domain-containing protein n=1 Tax=Glossina brevipalpis TaxID=37001 RepID=A0A1A9WCA0_9MUSC
MAKIEAGLAKKRKAKKRKLTTAESDDEIANKSLIVEEIAEEIESIPTAAEQQEPERTGKKRKNLQNGEVKEKRSKFLNDDDDEHQDAADFHEPTEDELKESEKPENTLALMTIRQQKRERHQKLLEKQEGKSVEREVRRNEDYLQLWKHSRNNWKFEKLRQISIEQTMLEKLNSDIWPLALEYLAGTKGAAKERLTKIANDTIEQLDKQTEQSLGGSEKQNLLHSTKYQRARDILQMFA